jgi:inner membrane transporter RhtA
MCLGTFFIGPLGIFSGDLAALNLRLLLMGIAVAMLTSAIPFTLEMKALKQLSTQHFGILMSLHPAFAALSGLLFLKEQLSILQWASVACVIAASAGATYFSGKRA